MLAYLAIIFETFFHCQKLHYDFKRFHWGDSNTFYKDIQQILEYRKKYHSSDRETVLKILASLNARKEHGNRRSNFGQRSYFGESGHKSDRSSGFRPGGHSKYSSQGGFNYEEFFRKTYGSYSKGSGSHQNESGRTQPKPPELDDNDVLGLGKTAAKVEVKKRYRELALEHHPGCLTS